jgi:hypothetical protein
MGHAENTAYIVKQACQACLMNRCLAMDALLLSSLVLAGLCLPNRCLAMSIQVTILKENTYTDRGDNQHVWKVTASRHYRISNIG